MTRLPLIVVMLLASCAGTLEGYLSSNDGDDKPGSLPSPFVAPTPPTVPGGGGGGNGSTAGVGQDFEVGLLAATEQVDGACTGPGGAAVICVDANATGSEQGTAEQPYSTIGAAIEAANDGDELRVAGGNYPENVIVEGKALRLLGGFAGAGDFNTRTPADHVTTIDGQGGDAAVVLLDAGASELSGFRVINGTGSERIKDIFYLGGGLYIDGGAPRVANNLIEKNDNVTSHPNNDLENQGAGIYADGAKVTISRNIVRDNRTGRGAIAASGGEVRIEQNLIEKNISIGDHGGGMYLAGPSIKVLGNRIVGNRLEPKQGHGGWGGGILVFDEGTNIELTGNIITENYAPAGGSGAFVDDGAVAILTNELIYNNSCPEEGGGAGLYVDGLNRALRSRATLNNCTIAAHDCNGEGQGLFVERSVVIINDSILWGNGGDDVFTDQWSDLEVRYSISEESIEGEGNQSADPLFADPASGDFHLRSMQGRFEALDGSWAKDTVHSPAIDAANPTVGVGDEPTPTGDRRNVGAYGGTWQASQSK